MTTTISVKRAAELLGTSVASVREIIAHDSLPIGYMLPTTKKTQKRTFRVFAFKVAELTGLSIEDVIGENK